MWPMKAETGTPPIRHPEARALFLGRASKGDGPDLASWGASGNGAGRASFEARRKERGRLRMTDRSIAFLATIALFWPTTASAQSVDEFYRSRSITMLIGSGAGGGYD